MTNKFLFLTILFVCLGASQASTAMTPVGAAVDKIDLVSGVNTWEALDQRHLVLSLGQQQTYLVTLAQSCHTLPFATHLGVSASNNIVWAGFDYITADGERCAINSINELSDQQRQRLMRL